MSTELVSLPARMSLLPDGCWTQRPHRAEGEALLWVVLQLDKVAAAAAGGAVRATHVSGSAGIDLSSQYKRQQGRSMT